MDDPYVILGIDAAARPEEVAAAYRRAAKRWHPDRNDDEESARRMAEVNAAYDLLRTGGMNPVAEAGAPVAAGGGGGGPGAWLARAVRRALGRELLEALERGEDVRHVTPTSTWTSSRAVLAVTDRRLLWLHDDLVTGRVQWLRFSRIAEIAVQLRRPRRRVAILRVQTDDGRRLAFSELRPPTAEAIVRHVAAARAAGGSDTRKPR